MLAVSENELLQTIFQWWWPFLRVSGFLLTAPVIATRSVPVRVRLVLALALTLAIAPQVQVPDSVDPLSASGALLAASQVVTGATMGLLARLVFVALEVAGQILAQLMGLSFASMVDPASGNQVPVVSQFYMVMTTLLYLSIDGHLALLRVLAESFQALPVSMQFPASKGMENFTAWGGWLFAQSLMVVLPAVTAMLMVNISFGVMSRVAPQMNIFAVGFPIMILGGIAVMVVSLAMLPGQVTPLFGVTLDMLQQDLLTN